MALKGYEEKYLHKFLHLNELHSVIWNHNSQNTHANPRITQKLSEDYKTYVSFS